MPRPPPYPTKVTTIGSGVVPAPGGRRYQPRTRSPRAPENSTSYTGRGPYTPGSYLVSSGGRAAARASASLSDHHVSSPAGSSALVRRARSSGSGRSNHGMSAPSGRARLPVHGPLRVLLDRQGGCAEQAGGRPGEARRGDAQPADERHARVPSAMLDRRPQDQVAGRRDAAADHDHIEIDERRGRDDGDSQRAPRVAERGKRDRVTE